MMMRLKTIPIWLLLGYGCVSCGGHGDSTPKDKVSAAVTISMQFESAQNRDFNVQVAVSAEAPLRAENLSLVTDYGSLGEIRYSVSDEKLQAHALLSPPQSDDSGDIWTGEISLTARYLDSDNALQGQITRTALVFTDKLSIVGQAQAVPGWVNTAGVEDSPQISADGQWLIVGTYTPVDLGYCLVNERRSTHPACNKNDYTEQIRPGLFGAQRIIDANNIDHAIEQIRYQPSGAAFPLATPPLASFGFERLQDGSYGNPFVLGIDSGGYTWNASYGFSFDRIENKQARVFYAFNPINDTPDTLTNIYFTDIELGRGNVLGVYRNAELQDFDSQKVTIDAVPICGDNACELGNPHITEQRLWFDNERQEDKRPSNDLFFVDLQRDAAGLPVSFSQPYLVPLSQVDRGESMPFMQADTLYYQCDTDLCRSKLLDAQNPQDAAAWGQEQVLITGHSNIDWQIKGGRAGRIIATTEPSVAHVNVNGESQTWLYFGYILQTHYASGDLEFGANWNVGRVRLIDAEAKALQSK